MRIYTENIITGADMYNSLAAVPGLGFEHYAPLPRPRLAARGWDILLRRAGSSRHFNSGQRGAGDEGAASWADYGWFLAALYAIDPTMKVRGGGNYDSADDFHAQTRDAFLGTRPPGTTAVRVRPGRGRPLHLREAPGFRPAPAAAAILELTPELAASMHDSLAALDKAASGDSNDHEIECGRDCADNLIILLELLGYPYKSNEEN
jgi:hypothetical protein